MGDAIRRDLCLRPDLLVHARFDLMVDAALFGPSARPKVECHGMLWQDGGGSWLEVVLLAGDRAAGVLALIGGGLAHLRSRRRR